MSRRAYVFSFILLAFTFVPVIFPLGAVSMIGPCSYVAFVTLPKVIASLFYDNSVPSIDGTISFLFTCYSLLFFILYGGLFYLCAHFTFRFSWEESNSKGRLFIQTIILIIVFSCSFLNVIHADSFVNATGTYDFWNGAARLLKTSR